MDNQGYVQNEKVDRRLSLAGMELPGPVSRRNSRAPPPFVPEVPVNRGERRLSLSGMEIPNVVSRRNSKYQQVVHPHPVVEDKEEVSEYSPPAYPGDKKQPGKVKKSYKRVKQVLQNNKITSNFFPPKGDVAINITLMITVVIIFLCARTVLGPYSALGGTIFAVFILIFFALVAGQIVLQAAALLSKMVGFDIRIPQLLGMMAVGIFCKNVPYNAHEFNSPECLNRSLAHGNLYKELHGNDSHLIDHEGLNLHSDDPNAHGVMMDVHASLKEGHSAIVDHLEKTTDNPKFSTTAKIFHAKAKEFKSPSNASQALKSHGEGFKPIPDSETLHHRARRSGGHDEPAVYRDPCVKRFIGGDVDPTVKGILRSACLTFILLMAGLELDPPQLWRLKWIVLRTTFIPCIVEAFAAALFCYLILGFPFLPGLCFGFVLCGVSPAVIIPGLVNLSQRGYGVKKGIPTLVIATCSADDLVAIGGFGIAAGITFNPDASISDLASHGPLEVLLGIAFGIFWGYICQWFPSKQYENYVFFRWVLLTAGGAFALFGAHMIHYDGAGGLACVIMAFVASIQWRREGWGDHNPVTDIYNKVWIILSPVIFSLIGTNINAEKMDGATVGMGVAVLVCCFLTRGFFTYWSAVCGGLDTKEKIFLAISWLPKATVQAALGPAFLEKAIAANLPEYVPIGETILTMAVISIAISAPIGAILILALGPVLLPNDFEGDEDEDEEAGELDVIKENMKEITKEAHH
ncbi:uncharacterized protein LOC111709609 isoform X2 [Eurytemora carolleeae]|uniref:uncharacterized protein LOC111709609 isoform X2 n=1 Tax=Eurytemora carolleeae TaxID=1294199 RepID=UPI000C777A32|nr:uncharacterized protein LOC111709609 isoform X2 [Eurytemora carolleeae]|eukprot:XP_023339125.1 uncharacterized protein LOC111709609 isoform X2 [Eurytemora affinis]